LKATTTSTVSQGSGKRSPEFMYFRIHIDHISGQRGVPDMVPDREFSAARDRPVGWVRRILGRRVHQKSHH
jgi:hypothetical protein